MTPAVIEAIAKNAQELEEGNDMHFSVIDLSKDFEEKSILAGEPQGSVLGLVLFLMYINDLRTIIATGEVSLSSHDTYIISSPR